MKLPDDACEKLHASTAVSDSENLVRRVVLEEVKLLVQELLLVSYGRKTLCKIDSW